MNAASKALRIAAKSSGGIAHAGGGRTDDVPMKVPSNSYVIPADIVSALGRGNTLAGMAVLDDMFPGAKSSKRGRGVDIVAAGGEYVVSSDAVSLLGDGDAKTGADILDAFISEIRENNIQTLENLPGPAKR